MPDPLKVALIGAGHMGQHHARALTERDDVEILAVCDTDAARADETALKCYTRSETEVGRLLADLDAAVIAAATGAHRDLALAMLEQDVSVLVEKPLAGTAAEAREIAEAAARSKAVCQVGHLLRFDPVTRALDGQGIRPSYIEITWAGPFTFRSTDIGVVMDLVIHGLDLAVHWVGEAPDRVDACGGTVIGPHEDLVNARLAFPGGAVANLTASRFSRSRERLVRIFTDRAYFRLDYGNRTAQRITPRSRIEEIDVENPPEGMTMEDLVQVQPLEIHEEPDALRGQLDAFLAAVRGGPVRGCTAEDGARAVAFAEQIVARARG